MKSRTPSAASSCAEARPIPVDAPVMRATFPFSEFLIQADRELHRARQPTSPRRRHRPFPTSLGERLKNSCDMCTLPSLGLEPEGVSNCQRYLASVRFVVQCATNDKISSVWPFTNICGFSVLGRDRKLRRAQRKACAGRSMRARNATRSWSAHPPDDVTFEPGTVGESSSATWGAGGNTYRVIGRQVMSSRLSEKVCIITGTGGSIGREAARTFAREGAMVVSS